MLQGYAKYLISFFCCCQLQCLVYRRQKSCIRLLTSVFFSHNAKGQGVLSDKLRSFSMQDLTLINTEDELDLHTAEVRTRREHMDEMSSGSNTLPRARSSSARHSKPTNIPSARKWCTHLQILASINCARE